MTATLRNGRPREQAMGALSRANEVRIANSITIMAIRRLPTKDAGLRAAVRLLREADMEDPIGAMPVYRLAFAPHYVREESALRMLAHAGIFADRSLRRLSERQRLALAAAMEIEALATRRRAGR